MAHFGSFSKCELTGRRWVVKSNPLLLMSRLISINVQPADQTHRSMLLPLRRGREQEAFERGGYLPPNFYDTESVLNGLEDSSHLALK